MRLLLAFLGATLLAGPVWAFSPHVHQKTTAKAIDTLPPGLKAFYRTHRFEIPSLALEATPLAEGPERRFAVDRLLSFPFADLPHNETALKARFGDELAGQVGRLPWLIHESYDRLVAAFAAKDKMAILAESDVIASLLTELANPLCLSDNYDGQKTEQHGLWLRFTIRFPEAAERKLGFGPDAARYLDEPKEYVFSRITASYVWLDNLLYADELAKRGKTSYGDAYYEALQQRAGSILKMQLSQVTSDVGSYWYTAWTAAGRPDLK